MNVTVVTLEEVRMVVRAEVERAVSAERRGFLTLKSAAAYLDVTEQALRARVKRGEILVHRRDGRLYFDRDELERYVRGGV